MNAELKKSYKRSFTGGRSGFAVISDRLLFSVFSGFIAYFIVKPFLKSRLGSIALSVIILLLVFTILDAVNSVKLKKHAYELRVKTKKELFRQKLLCTKEQAILKTLSSCDKFANASPVLLQSTAAPCADEVYSRIRSDTSDGRKLVFVCVTPPENDAAPQVSAAGIELEFIDAYDVKELKDAFCVSEAEVDKAIIAANRHRGLLIKNPFRDIFKRSRGKKYFFLGIALYAFSFFSRHWLLLRILGSAAFTAGAFIAVGTIAAVFRQGAYKSS